MEGKSKILIDPIEFQKKVLDYIGYGEIDKMIDSTVYKDKPECRGAIIHGMALASMLTGACTKISVKEEPDLTELVKAIEEKMTYMCGCQNCIETVTQIIKGESIPFNSKCDECGQCKD